MTAKGCATERCTMRDRFLAFLKQWRELYPDHVMFLSHMSMLVWIALHLFTPLKFFSQNSPNHSRHSNPVGRTANVWTWTASYEFCYCHVYGRGSRVRFPAGAGNFSLRHRIQNGSGAHPTSYPMGTRGSHKIAIQLYLLAESCIICSSRSRRPVRKFSDTSSYTSSYLGHKSTVLTSTFCALQVPRSEHWDSNITQTEHLAHR
jgi:hypothetical protein